MKERENIGKITSLQTICGIYLTEKQFVNLNYSSDIGEKETSHFNSQHEWFSHSRANLNSFAFNFIIIALFVCSFWQ